MENQPLPTEDESPQLDIASNQIDKSLSSLSQLHTTSHQHLTALRLQTQHSESDRRLTHEAQLTRLKGELRREAEDGQRRQAAVSMRWSSVLTHSVPQDIQNALEEQRRECDQIRQEKERIISLLKDALERKDQEYVSALRKQARDMDILTERMGQQMKLLEQSYEKELEHIELAFNQERDELIKRNNDQLEQLKEERRRKEKVFVEDRIQQVENNEKELNDLRDREMEKFAETKKEKDDKVHELERSIDYMRAKYELYSEKLKYYHTVLHERCEENRTAIRNNKTIVAKLQDQLSGIKAKYAKDDKKFKQENHETTEQYKRMAKQYKDLLVKFKYFEKADKQKYKDVWKMNEKIVKDLADKLLKADKIISEQLLGLNWSAPSDDLFKSPLDFTQTIGNPTQGDGSEQASSAVGGGTQNLSFNASGLVSPAGPPSQSENRDNVSSATGASHASSFSQNTRQQNQQTTTQQKNQIPNVVRKTVLSHLCDSAGFLIEDKVRQIIDQLTNESEQQLLKVDGILRALGVTTNEDIDVLIRFFGAQVENADILMDQEVDDETKEEILTSTLTPDATIRALSQFIEHQQTSEMQTKTPKPKILTAQERLKNKQRKEEKAFWERIENVIPENKLKVWNALENAQEKYSKVLTERDKLIQETEMIRIQNNELRDLLNQYMNQKINEELFVPPRF